jgi:hypothetical protein
MWLQSGNGFPSNGKADSDHLSTSTESPSPDSPSANNSKSKIDIKFGPDGQLTLNARQRRTLRRALQRQPELQLADGSLFSFDGTISDQERHIVIEVVQNHIGRSLPESTDLDQLVKMLLNLGTTDAGDL